MNISSNYRIICFSQLGNELNDVKHCSGVYEQNSKVNSFLVHDWTAELMIIASNDNR